jgi:hypothetical protein
MVRQAKIEIKLNEDEGYTQVFIDGNRIDGVRGYKLEQYTDNTPILTLHINALDATVNRECILKLNDTPCEADVKLDYIDASKTK